MSYNYAEERNLNYHFFIVPIMLFMVTFIIWAYFSEIDESVKGSGKVIPSGQTRLVQHLEGGIIKDILVAEGDSVLAGETLFRIQNQYFISNRQENMIKLAAYKAKLIRIKALINNQDTVNFEKEMVENISQIIENEVQIFYGEKKKHHSQVSVLQEQLLQKKAQLRELEVKLENLSIEYNLALESLKIQEELSKKGAISRERYLQHFAAKQKIYTHMEETRYSIPVIRQEIEEWNKKIEGKLFEIKSELLQQSNEVHIEIKKLEEIIKADIDRDKRIEVVSPTKGVINKIHFNTIGGIVKSGETIAEISPLDDELMIEAKINTTDRAYIYPGQDVSIEITAYDFAKYGLLKGKLVSISPDSTADEKGNNFYMVKVKAHKYQFDENSPILIGMTANINILTGKRTVLQYLLKPMKDISYKAFKEH